jgi:hypothetical protein
MLAACFVPVPEALQEPSSPLQQMTIFLYNYPFCLHQITVSFHKLLPPSSIHLSLCLFT